MPKLRSVRTPQPGFRAIPRQLSIQIPALSPASALPQPIATNQYGNLGGVWAPAGSYLEQVKVNQYAGLFLLMLPSAARAAAARG